MQVHICQSYKIKKKSETTKRDLELLKKVTDSVIKKTFFKEEKKT